jgi:hypothetical protein
MLVLYALARQLFRTIVNIYGLELNIQIFIRKNKCSLF